MSQIALRKAREQSAVVQASNPSIKEFKASLTHRVSSSLDCSTMRFPPTIEK